MERKSAHFWLISFGVLILVLLYQIFQNIQIRTNRKVTMGTIVKVKDDYAESDSGRGGPFWSVDYEFQVGSKKYGGSESLAYSLNPQIGSPITIFYAGNNPEYNTANPALAETGFRFFVDWLLLIGGVVGFIFYVRWYMKKIRH
jgi:hypothetical protein